MSRLVGGGLLLSSGNLSDFCTFTSSFKSFHRFAGRRLSYPPVIRVRVVFLKVVLPEYCGLRDCLDNFRVLLARNPCGRHHRSRRSSLIPSTGGPRPWLWLFQSTRNMGVPRH